MCWSASVRALAVGGEHDPRSVMIKVLEAAMAIWSAWAFAS
jgi:hypothetical protein